MVGDKKIKIEKTDLKLSSLKLNEPKSKEQIIMIAAELLAYYTKKNPDQELIINIYNK